METRLVLLNLVHWALGKSLGSESSANRFQSNEGLGLSVAESYPTPREFRNSERINYQLPSLGC